MSYLINTNVPVGSALNRLGSLIDVEINNPLGKDVLSYDSATQTWVNDASTGAPIDDDDVSTSKTWSSDKINSKLVNLPQYEVTTYVTAEVKNGLLLFSCQGYTPASLNTWVTIATLASGYKPIQNVYFTGMATNMNHCLFYIGSDGLVQIRAAASASYVSSVCVPVATS